MTLDLTELREDITGLITDGLTIPPITNEGVLALIDRIKTAELWTTVLPCKVTHEDPYDFDQCDTHDRTFPRGGECDHAGLSEIDWLDKRESEQRSRAIAAETRVEELEATIQRARDARSNHPAIPECDRYTPDDTITCGWKHALEDIDKALEGETQ